MIQKLARLRRDVPHDRETLPQTAEQIRMVTNWKQGFASWARTVNGRYAIIRIAEVQPATYGELMDGKAARIQFEWIWR